MIIRELEAQYIPDCVELVRLNFTEATALKAQREIRTAYHDSTDHHSRLGPRLEHYHYVAIESSKVVGFAGMIRSRKTPDAYDFTWVAVRPDKQGHGIGAALVRHRIAEAEKFNASAIELTTRVPGWFRRFGFKIAFKFDGGLVLMVKQLREVSM